MATVLPTTFPNAFTWMKIIVLDKNFVTVCSQASTSQQLRIGLIDGLAPNKHHVITWTNDGAIYWHHLPLNINELSYVALCYNFKWPKCAQ